MKNLRNSDKVGGRWKFLRLLFFDGRETEHGIVILDVLHRNDISIDKSCPLCDSTDESVFLLVTACT